VQSDIVGRYRGNTGAKLGQERQAAFSETARLGMRSLGGHEGPGLNA